MKTLKAYGKRELTTEPLGSGQKTYDVQFYADRNKQRKLARFMWYFSGGNYFNKRRKYVTINCFTYKIVWI